MIGVLGVLFALFVRLGDTLMMYLTPGQAKCFTDEFAYDVLVSGDYRVVTPGQNGKGLKLTITDSDDNVSFDNKMAQSGKFGFTTAVAGEFEFCLLDYWLGEQDTNLPARLVEFNLHSGVEAQDYSAIAKKEHLKPLELELRRIEDTVEMIQKDFEYMRDREAKMRDTNESTFERVSYLSVFSIGCLISLAAWQLLYLRRYFARKKLL